MSSFFSFHCGSESSVWSKNIPTKKKDITFDHIYLEHLTPWHFIVLFNAKYVTHVTVKIFSIGASGMFKELPEKKNDEL